MRVRVRVGVRFRRKSSIPASRQAGMPVPRFCALMPMMGSLLWSIMPGRGKG